MSWVGIGSAAIGAVGGLLGGNSSTQTTQNTLDPRIGSLLYGGSGGGGLLNSVNNTASQQIAQGGLNNIQTAGLNSQLGVLTDPSYTTGFNQMRSLGSSLLGQPIAGNPFTGGGSAVAAPTMPQMGSMPGRATTMPVNTGYQGTGQAPMVSGGAINANTVRGPQPSFGGGGLLGGLQGLQVSNTSAPQAPMTQADYLQLLKNQQSQAANSTDASGGGTAGPGMAGQGG